MSDLVRDAILGMCIAFKVATTKKLNALLQKLENNWHVRYKMLYEWK